MYEWTIENCYENFKEKKESQEIYFKTAKPISSKVFKL